MKKADKIKRKKRKKLEKFRRLFTVRSLPTGKKVTPPDYVIEKVLSIIPPELEHCFLPEKSGAYLEDIYAGFYCFDFVEDKGQVYFIKGLEGMRVAYIHNGREYRIGLNINKKGKKKPEYYIQQTEVFQVKPLEEML